VITEGNVETKGAPLRVSQGQDVVQGDPRRLIRSSTTMGLIFAFSSLVVSVLFGRWDWFLGLLIGSALSLLNFRFLANSASKWLGEGTIRIRSIGKGFLARLLISGIVLAVSILYLPLNIFGLAIGLFVAQAGLLCNLFRQGTGLR